MAEVVAGISHHPPAYQPAEHRVQVYGRVSHADEPYHRGVVETQDANVSRLVELCVLPAGYRQLEGEGPLAKELWQLADWVKENFARKPDQMQQAIDRPTLRSRPSTNPHWMPLKGRRVVAPLPWLFRMSGVCCRLGEG